MKWKIPLVPRRVGGLACPRPMVTIRVVSRYGWSPIRFSFDTGADVTTIPIPLARREGIAFAESQSVRGTATGLLGAATRYRGAIRVVVGGEGFEWPCDFLAPPASTPPGMAAAAYAVLGRAPILTAFAACVDDEYLYLRRRYLERPAWYRLVRRLWPLLAKRHHPHTPL